MAMLMLLIREIINVSTERFLAIETDFISDGGEFMCCDESFSLLLNFFKFRQNVYDFPKMVKRIVIAMVRTSVGNK